MLKPVHSLAEVEDFLLFELPKSKAALMRHNEGIVRARTFFDLLENPQNNLRAIHLAATSGKGSTGYLLQSLLLAHGKTTGLHVSPHVYDYRERLTMNGELADETTVCDELNKLMPAIEQMGETRFGRPTFFEVSNALAFRMFDEAKVDYTIIETGLGGLNDSTNTIERHDKLAIIGQIGLDHVGILADVDELKDAVGEHLLPADFPALPSIPERITAQKAAIMRPAGQAIALHQAGEVNDVITRLAEFRHTDLTMVTPTQLVRLQAQAEGRQMVTITLGDATWADVHFNLLGEHQLANLSLALTALQLLADRDGWQLDESAVRKALATIELPGRFERRQVNGKTIILDGSHNPQKMQSLVRTFQQAYPSKQAAVLLAMAKGKDVASTLKILAPVAAGVYCTDFFTEHQDFKSASLSPSELKALADTIVACPVVAASSPDKALHTALNSDQEFILITGSFYFLDKINDILKTHENNNYL